MASYENHNKDDGDVDMTRKGLDSDDDEEEMEEEEEDDQHATVEGTEGYGMFRAPESKYSVDRERQELHKAPTQEAETLLSYIDELLDKQRRNLYGDSWAAQTILQALPPLCQQYVTYRKNLILFIELIHRWIFFPEPGLPCDYFSSTTQCIYRSYFDGPNPWQKLSSSCVMQ